MKVAALVKQIPKFEAMQLGSDGRLVREGLELEMNAYCRRAVSKGCELARDTGGTCTVFTLGPPSAEDCLREAIAWGADDGVLITDPAFAGSDTLATARALAAALEREGPFDLVLVGRNSVDADTGQVGPELAELLDLPFATGVRELDLDPDGGSVLVRCEHDDEWVQAEVSLPAVLSTAERLCEPSKVPPEGRAAVDPGRLRTLGPADLGPGPWGQAGSPTSVGDVMEVEADRLGIVNEGTVGEQVGAAVRVLADRDALVPTDGEEATEKVAPSDPSRGGPAVGVVVEPDRERVVRELLGAAARLAAEIGGRTVALGGPLDDPCRLASWGADEVVTIAGTEVEEDVARAVSGWAGRSGPWAVLAPGTAWGREVASRTAAALGAGLTGDAVGLGVEDGRLVAHKPAFGGRMVAAIHASSPVQMATVRPGLLPLPAPRQGFDPDHSTVEVSPRGRVRVAERTRDDDMDAMPNADVVVGVGQGVSPEDYAALDGLLELLGAELGATRKVTDQGWLPRARQIGITGHSISPRLFVALGSSGKFNHMVGVRNAGTILAVNPDRSAPVFDWCDVGIVADWREVVPELTAQLEAVVPA